MGSARPRALRVCRDRAIFVRVAEFRTLDGKGSSFRKASTPAAHPLILPSDPHTEVRERFFFRSPRLDDEDHTINGFLRCNRCSPYWRPHPRPPALQFYRDRAIFCLARSFRTYNTGGIRRDAIGVPGASLLLNQK